MTEKRFKLAYEKGIEAIFEDFAKYPYPRRMTNKEVERKLNEQDEKIKELKKEKEQLRQKIQHWVYVDVDNERGCVNCKYDIDGICSIWDCGTHDYLMGVSECGLRYWECKDE